MTDEISPCDLVLLSEDRSREGLILVVYLWSWVVQPPGSFMLLGFVQGLEHV